MQNPTQAVVDEWFDWSRSQSHSTQRATLAAIIDKHFSEVLKDVERLDKVIVYLGLRDDFSESSCRDWDDLQDARHALSEWSGDEPWIYYKEHTAIDAAMED